MSDTPQDPSNGQKPGVDLTLTDSSAHSSKGQESLRAEVPSILPTRISVDASEPARSQAENGALPTSSDTIGGAGLPSEAPATPLPQLLPLQTTLTTVDSATSLLSRPQSIVGNPSSTDDLVNGPSNFELLKRRTLAQQPYRGMVRTTECDDDQMPNYAQSPHVKERWRKFISTIQTQNMKKRMISFWGQGAGLPCTRCESMKLTRDKFIIYEFSKHKRTEKILNAAHANDNDTLGPAGLDFGPKEFKLGTIHEIYSRRRSCPFCRLATDSLSEKFEAYLKQLLESNANPDAEAQAKKDFYLNVNVACYVSWQIDGRKLLRDSSGQIIGDRACTRRMRLHWKEKKLELRETTFFTSYVVLMAPREADPGLFLGRSIDSIRPDAARIRQWVSFCEDSHGDVCKSQSRFEPLQKSFFGVIDVRDMCLTKLPPGQRYIALSYTWGNNKQPPFQTRKANIKKLLAPGGIRKELDQIPRTIRHAIDLVGDLGERYLWVDSLCIIQDSERSWALNSRVMDSVYGNAYFTICAADGDNNNAGLRALHNQNTHREQTGSTVQKPHQNIVQYSREFSLMTTQPAETYIRESAWDTRAWTFQERLLSARNLIFAAGRVYFQCRRTARSVDIVTEHESVGWSIEFKDSPLLMLHKLRYQPLSVYKKALELYMVRKLSREKDILAAFTGIGNLVCTALGGNLVFGLPSSHFDWALLWEPRDAATLRPGEENDSEKFPSWSWCGWKNQIMEYKSQMLDGCENNLHEWLMKHTWITWYIRDGNGNLRLVWDGQQPKDSMLADESASGYCRPADIDISAGTHDHYGRYIPEAERQRKRSSGFSSILDECPFDVNITVGVDESMLNSTEKDMPFLQFHTWSAYFRISEQHSKPENRWGTSFRRYGIEDYKDDWCGTILLDKHWVSLRPFPDQPLEFIAISDAKHFSEIEYADWANYIPVERKESIWDLYYVLLVETRKDVVYRVGLGKVYKSAFHNSCTGEGKQWKEFILG